MNPYSTATAWLSTRHVGLEGPKIPHPTPPNSKEIVDKVHDGGDWLSVRSKSFWLIIVVLFVAYLIGKALKKPLVKGIALGMIILAIILVVYHNK